MSKNSLKPATKAVYTPLIDMVPSHPATMMTAMVEAQKLTKQTGQFYTVFTADQQLYRVMVNVLWVDPEMLRLGGMHLLMSFVGCVGTSNTTVQQLLILVYKSQNTSSIDISYIRERI